MKWCLVVLILAGVTRADNSVESDYSIFKCPDLNSQEEIDLDKVRVTASPSSPLGRSRDYVTVARARGFKYRENDRGSWNMYSGEIVVCLSL